MKVNKIFILVMAMVTIFTLTACKKEKNENEVINNVDSTVINDISGDDNVLGELEISGDYAREIMDFQSQFKEEIQDYVGYMTNIKLFFENNDNSMDYGVSNLLTHLRNFEDPFASLSYVLKDLNNDGVDEFILFDDTASGDMKNSIINLSTKSGDLTYTVLNSQENMLYKLYDNNIIGVEFSDIEYMNFFELDKDMNFISVDSIEATTASGDVQNILNKYKEAKLELNKIK